MMTSAAEPLFRRGRPAAVCWTLLRLLPIAVALLLPMAANATPDERLKLWHRAQQCVEEAKQGSLQYPCVRVSKSLEFVVVHDTQIGKRGVFMILPTMRVTGIEDAAALSEPVRNFFRYGWEVLTTEIRKHPGELAMAINNRTHRSQDQLHIHLGCVAPEFRAALDRASLTNKWQQDAIRIKGREYAAIELGSLAQSPFLSLKEHLDAQQPKGWIGDHSLAVIGQPNGRFVVLDTTIAAAELALDEGDTCHRSKGP